MHLANLRYSLSNCACSAGVPARRRRVDEPPHAAELAAETLPSVSQPRQQVQARPMHDRGRAKDVTAVVHASPSVATVPVLALKTEAVFS